MKNTFKVVALAGSLAFAGENIAKAVYNADVVVDPTVSGNGIFSSPGVLAPVGTVVWFVASTDNNLGTIGGATSVTPDQILGNDTLIHQTRIDGDLFQGGLGAGNLFHTIEGIADSVSSQNIYMLVFSSRVYPNFSLPIPTWSPADGDVFGFDDLGVNPNPFPNPGNANYNPTDGIVFGYGINVVAVPEPSTYLLGLVGLAGLVGYRRMRR